jgi:hypothetical protein
MVNENEFMMYLKHYRFELQSYLNQKKEEFFNDKIYKRIDLCDSSKSKIEKEIKKLDLIVNSYERFKQGI